MLRVGVETVPSQGCFAATVGATAVTNGQVVKFDTALIVDAGASTSSEGLYVCRTSAAAGEVVLVDPIACFRMAVASAPTMGVHYDLTNGTTPNLSSGSGSGSPCTAIPGPDGATSYDAASGTALFTFNR